MNQTSPTTAVRPASRLRRDLGTLESYAALIGILIGAGIFQVTSRAWELSGPSVILGYAALIPVILSTSIPYAAYLSTPLGREPGGEYLHISRTLGGYRLAYVGTWLKIISYVGAGAYLANALSGYVLAFAGGRLSPTLQFPIALASMVLFYMIHVIGVRWFGRFQVIMSTLKCLALFVLIVPGLFFIKSENYSPFFSQGLSGFGASLLPLFFAYAGFESLAQTAGEVKDSTRRLPKILLIGITATALIYVFTSIVSFGVLPGSSLQANDAPMAEVASVYLPTGAALFVTFGAIMAIMTALNGTILVPSRMGLMLAADRLAPQWVGFVNPKTGTPIRGLTLTLLACAALLVSGQLSLALNVAVFALLVLYFMHSLVFLMLPRLNPGLNREIKLGMSKRLQQTSAVVSLVSIGLMILIQLWIDFQSLRTSSFADRVTKHSLTSIELLVVWSIVAASLYAIARSRARQDPPETSSLKAISEVEGE
jgi:basic amino acid/polyamine antiporter, APA family